LAAALGGARRCRWSRTDIRFWDEHLDRNDQMALVAVADCLVLLHRSEGRGRHLAEAMWLGTPPIATLYSGNVDFVDDSCALLIDAARVAVGRGRAGDRRHGPTDAVGRCRGNS
jgi:glycosyltransferase involved in cell wall biosynthesis